MYLDESRFFLLQSKNGPSTTILNVDTDSEILTRSEIYLPLSDVSGINGKYSKLCIFIIS